MRPEDTLFTCQMCDDCCYGQNTVALTGADIVRMARQLGLSETEFLEKHCIRKGTQVQMKVIDNHCVFWDGRCSVHAFKPYRCREWPFVPSLLDQSSFLVIQENCPGFNKKITFEEALPYIQEVLGQKRPQRDQGKKLR